ncbi:MAG TPA: epoxide hydrolase [Rhizomicrobium sp.]|jgi:microsomal epoxide hydrolase|nr:epoxide hydrolase [Rhizomicrobium sp.]
MTVYPFHIEIPDGALADLKERLSRTRWPDAMEGGGWRYGTDLEFLKALTSWWRDRFDWRAAEARLNAFPQFVAEIDGIDVHFLHAKGKGPDPLPLIITHGWPSSVAEFTKLIPLLTDPESHGGRAEDAFDVVAPSLPGFGFSQRPCHSGMSSRAVTGLWTKLMKRTLGYQRFFAHGGDIGGGITNRLGRWKDAAAIHTMVAAPVADTKAPPPSDAEKAWLARVELWEKDEGAYGHQQRTRPQTLAFGLNDSPVGLAAWIVEKWQSWSDCGGDILSRFTTDELLTNIGIYWFTETIGSSMRMYYESAHDPRPESTAKIDVPARIFLTREDVDLCPPEYVARSYTDFSYGIAERGGHFLAAEEPDILAGDIRTWFRRFR